MRIERFSIGFGPGILKRKSKKTGTIFQLAPIPFGGFVEIRGMNIAEDVDPDDQLAYPNRPAWQRFLTIFAGPATNYLSAIVLAFALYTCHGVDSGALVRRRRGHARTTTRSASSRPAIASSRSITRRSGAVHADGTRTSRLADRARQREATARR